MAKVTRGQPRAQKPGSTAAGWSSRSMPVPVCVSCTGQGEPGEAAVTNTPQDLSSLTQGWIAHAHKLRGRAGGSPGQQLGIQEASLAWPPAPQRSSRRSPPPGWGRQDHQAQKSPPAPPGVTAVSHLRSHLIAQNQSREPHCRGEGEAGRS